MGSCTHQAQMEEPFVGAVYLMRSTGQSHKILVSRLPSMCSSHSHLTDIRVVIGCRHCLAPANDTTAFFGDPAHPVVWAALQRYGEISVAICT